MAETKMRLVDWLDDLCVRFIINLPREDMESVERICFQVEEAQWFYEDFIRPTDATLPSMSLKQFCLLIFQHCPLLANFSEDHHLQAFEEFLTYKTRVPVRGAILLNEAMDHVLLVKGWKKNASWSFPRGKINKDERDLDCAIREVYEETGYDIRRAGLERDDSQVHHIEVTMREQNLKMFVFRGVPMDTMFEPRTRKEISKIAWYKLASLPGYHKKKQQQHQQGVGAEMVSGPKLYMVAPFFGPLKRWVAQETRATPMSSAMAQQLPLPNAEDAWQQQYSAAIQKSFGLEDHPAQLLQSHQPTQGNQGVLDAAAKIKALLSVKPFASSTKPPSSSSQEASLLAMLRRPPKETLLRTFEQPSSAADLSTLDTLQSNEGRKTDLSPVLPLGHSFAGPNIKDQPPTILAAPQPYERTGDAELAQKDHHNLSEVPSASQPSALKLNSHAMSLLNSFKSMSSPSDSKNVTTGQALKESRQQTWKKFAEDLPQAEAIAREDAATNSKARPTDDGAPTFAPIYKETFRQTFPGMTPGQRQVVAVSRATLGGPAESFATPAPAPAQQAPEAIAVERNENIMPQASKAATGSVWGKLPTVQAASLIDLFKAPSNGVISNPPTALTPGLVELSATRSPDSRQHNRELAMTPETPKTAKAERNLEPGIKVPLPSSATAKSPMNTPETGTVRRRNRGGHQGAKSHDVQVTPIQILKRPVSDSIKEPEAQTLSDPSNSTNELADPISKPLQPFVPQILARPLDPKSFAPARRVLEKSIGSIPSTPTAKSKDNISAKPFQILKRPQPSESTLSNNTDVLRPLPSAPQSTPSAFDHPTSTSNDRKQTLLSLFGGNPSSTIPTATTPPVLPTPSSLSADTAVISPVSDPLQLSVASLAELRVPPPAFELSRSRINSIASAPRAASVGAGAGAVGGGGRPQTPMSPHDRGFLMSFLEGVVKSAAR